MNQLEYLKLLKLARTALEEYKNWDEEELVIDNSMMQNNTEQKKVEPNVEKINKEEINNLEKQEEAIDTITKNVQTKNAEQKLEDLKKQIVGCKKCDLGKYRLNAVFGSGDAYADIMFVGEGPGFQEDHKGHPFIGKAGDLQWVLLEKLFILQI